MIICGVIHTLFVVAVLFADLSPDVYKDLQQKAPEALAIRVVAVHVHRSFSKPSSCAWHDFEVARRVNAEAVVQRVFRSQSGVHVGDVIKIEYLTIRHCSEYNGPRSAALLDDDDRVTAYLKRSGKVFFPAARGASFVR